MKDYFPIVKNVEPLDNFKVIITFDDGKTVLYDVVEDIKQGGIFEPLKDLKFFKERCLVLNDTLAWDITGNCDVCSCIDIDPFMLYDLPEVNN